MLRENIPIKTCDEIRNSIKGCPIPCNDNEHDVGHVIYETYYAWHSINPEPHGKMASWYSEIDQTEVLYYQAGSRAMFRIQDTLQELLRTGYRLRDIRHHWSEPMVCKMFPANAYIYDDRPVDIVALEEEYDFLDYLLQRMQQTKDARRKAISRYYEREQKKQSETLPRDT